MTRVRCCVRLKTLASSLFLASALSGWTTTQPTAAQAADGDTLTGAFDVGPGGLQGNFNPLMATAGFTWLSLYFEPLVIWDEGLAAIEGDLAESYEVSDDKQIGRASCRERVCQYV